MCEIQGEPALLSEPCAYPPHTLHSQPATRNKPSTAPARPGCFIYPKPDTRDPRPDIRPISSEAKTWRQERDSSLMQSAWALRESHFSWAQGGLCACWCRGQARERERARERAREREIRRERERDALFRPKVPWVSRLFFFITLDTGPKSGPLALS